MPVWYSQSRHLADESAQLSKILEQHGAEVLEPDDERRIAAVFGVPVQQVYQCTEGFLGASCPVQLTCMDYAFTANIQHGTLGGMTAKEREKFKRRQADQRRKRKAATS